MKLVLGCDHAGFDLKETLQSFLLKKGIEVEDVGCLSSERCDYPEIAEEVVRRVLEQCSKGLIVCGSGIGVSMVANKFKGIRAALVRSVKEAKLSRQHNDANILCLGGRLTSTDEAFDIVMAWLDEPFQEGRHSQRLELFSKRGEVFKD